MVPLIFAAGSVAGLSLALLLGKRDAAMLTTLEWPAGSLLGLLGAYLLATHGRISRYGWIAFLAANIVMMAFALGIDRYGLLIQQVGFTGTSLLGLRRTGLWARRTCHEG
jgi:hypothetical protein